MKIGSLFLKEY